MIVETTEGYAVQMVDLITATPLPVAIEMKTNPIMADRSNKTNMLEPGICEKIEVGETVSVTMRGELCSEYSALLLAYFENESGGVYSIPATSPAELSDTTYNIYKYCPGTSPYYDVALGCKCSALNITGETNGLLQFEATFEAVSLRRGIASTGGDELSDVPANICPTPFRFADITGVALYGGFIADNITSLAINLSKTLADTNVTMQNSAVKTKEVVLEHTGTLGWSNIYDDLAEKSTVVEDNLEALPTENVLTIANADYTWAMAAYGQVSDFTLPDEDKGLCVSSYVLDLQRDDSFDPITITVTAL
jgi:hypothetical protein